MVASIRFWSKPVTPAPAVWANWVAETGIQPNTLVAFDVKSRRWVASVPVGAKAPNTVRHMIFDKKTRQLWFGADQNFIGSAKVPGPAVVP